MCNVGQTANEGVEGRSNADNLSYVNYFKGLRSIAGVAGIMGQHSSQIKCRGGQGKWKRVDSSYPLSYPPLGSSSGPGNR